MLAAGALRPLLLCIAGEQSHGGVAAQGHGQQRMDALEQHLGRLIDKGATVVLEGTLRSVACSAEGFNRKRITQVMLCEHPRLLLRILATSRWLCMLLHLSLALSSMRQVPNIVE